MTLTSTILQVCGVNNPEDDLNLTEGEFESLVDTYLDSTIEWVESYLNRDFEGTYPSGLEQILIEIVCNIIQGQVLRQDTPILDEENTRTRQLIIQVITPDLKTRLRPYFKRSIGMFGVGTKTQYDTLLDIEDDSDIDDVV